MRMVQDDVIRLLKNMAESSLEEEDFPNFLPWEGKDGENAYETGKQDGFTVLARKALQMMGVSYDATGN